MKTYIENHGGCFVLNGTTIPPTESNRHYRQMLEEVEKGEAEIVYFDHAKRAKEQKIGLAKTIREKYRAEGFEFAGKKFKAERKHQSDLTAILMAYVLGKKAETESQVWKIDDLTYHVFENKAGLTDFGLAMDVFIQKCFTVEAQVSQEISADPDLDVEQRFAELMG